MKMTLWLTLIYYADSVGVILLQQYQSYRHCTAVNQSVSLTGQPAHASVFGLILVNC